MIDEDVVKKLSKTTLVMLGVLSAFSFLNLLVPGDFCEEVSWTVLLNCCLLFIEKMLLFSGCTMTFLGCLVSFSPLADIFVNQGTLHQSYFTYPWVCFLFCRTAVRERFFPLSKWCHYRGCLLSGPIYELLEPSQYYKRLHSGMLMTRRRFSEIWKWSEDGGKRQALWNAGQQVWVGTEAYCLQIYKQ